MSQTAYRKRQQRDKRAQATELVDRLNRELVVEIFERKTGHISLDRLDPEIGVEA